MSNPTSGADKSDAAGRFPQIFAAEGAIFDVLLKDTGGSTLATELNVVSLGANTGALTRDFTTSRFQARGAGGVTFVEAGDPTGDDVGGTGSLGGWNGTQADIWTVNAVVFNVVGRLKENSKKLPGVIYTEATTFTGVASVVIPLTNDPTGVRGWQVDAIDLVTSANVSIEGQFSYDGGATYKSGANDYSYYSTWSGVVAVSANDTVMVLIQGIRGTAGTPPKYRATMRITSPLSTDPVILDSRACAYDSTSTLPMLTEAAAFGKGGYGRPTHLKLFPTSGTFSGIYRVMPERGFGET